MTYFLIGLVVGWLVTGVADYVNAGRIYRRAYDKGHEDGKQKALRQVSGW